MSEESSTPRSAVVLAINLVLLGLCFGGLLVLLLGYQVYRKRLQPLVIAPTITLRLTSTASRTPTITVSPTITLTPRPTSTATITPSPSWSPTPTTTPTETPFPSLTPALAAVYEGAYELVDWSDREANRMAQIAQGYPLAIREQADEPYSLEYLQAYSYPIFALQEALLRYPESPQTEEWRWILAYNLALNGDPEAGRVYAEIIADALNRGQVSIPELYAWFPIHEPRLNLFMTAVPTPPGYHNRYLVELRGEGGSAFISLLDKTPAYQAFPLFTAFDFAEPRTAAWILGDLDNKSANGAEIAIYLSSLSQETALQPPLVLSLSGVEPRQLDFFPGVDLLALGMQFENRWLLREAPDGKNELVFAAQVYPACPLDVEQTYRWNGTYFEAGELQVDFASSPQDPAQCGPLIDHAVHYWGPQIAAVLMERLLPVWPPEKDASGDPYPSDELDSFRYRMGVLRALSGNYQSAVAIMNDILTSPVVPTSRWIASAQNFLADYQQPDDIYRACRSSPECDPNLAIQALASRIPSNADPMPYLRNWGVEPISSGFFDFEDDDQSERWFTVRSTPQQKLNFWIVFKTGTNHHPVLVGAVNNRVPTIDSIAADYIVAESLSLQPAFLLDGKLARHVQRFPDTLQPYLLAVPLREEYPSRFFVPLESYKESLLAGSSPEVVQDRLQTLEKYPGLLCKSTWECDEYYYLLGLAAELSNDAESAVKAYQYLWLNYTKSPFTSMARLKLAFRGTLAPPTNTPTSTGTSTPPSPSPTVSPTASVSPTVTTTPATATPLRTPSPTVSGTPPTPTSTRTPTSIAVVPTPTTPFNPYEPPPYPYP